MVLLRSAIDGTTAVLGPPAATTSRSPRSCRPSSRGCSTRARRRRPRCASSCSAARRPTRRCSSRARDAGWPVAPTYGLTQACSAVTVAEPGDVETSGAPLPGARVAIAPDGEILVAGPTVAGGGVLRTGDLGRLDERGRLIVSAARSTRSSPAARTSSPPRSRRCCSSTRRSPRPASSAAPTPSGARPSPPPSSSAPRPTPRTCARSAAARLAPLQGAQGDRDRRRAAAQRRPASCCGASWSNRALEGRPA